MGIKELVEEARRRLSVTDLMYVAANLSRHHRIQGSKGLVEAAEFLKEFLEDSGLNVEVRDFSYSKPPRWLSDLPGWWVRNARLLIVEPELRFIESYPEIPTSVVAHSPGGEFEGEAVLFAPDDIPDHIDGVAVTKWVDLTYYLRVCERGAKAVLFYRDDAPADAVPYLGLFPSTNELNKVRIPAFSISASTYSLIKSLMRKGRVVIKGFIKAGFTNPYPCRVVSASIGRGREIHLTAHYCHPAGTINDNVSGAASLAVIAAVTGKLIESGNSCLSNACIKFLWVPEYYGSLSLLEDFELSNLLGNVAGCINLDMIGEKQAVTGSTLLIVRPPIHMVSGIEALSYLNVREYLVRYGLKTKSYSRIRFKVVKFEGGSDHESYISYEVPAISFINWPDRYYHTNMDTLDKLDPKLALNIAWISLKSALEYLTHKREFIDAALEYYKNMVYGEDMLEVVNDELLSDLRRKLYINGLNAFKLREDRVIKVKGRGVPSLRLILKKVTEEEREMLRKARERMPWIREALTLTLILAAKGLGIEGVRNALQGELGVRINESTLNMLIASLASIDAIE